MRRARIVDLVELPSRENGSARSRGSGREAVCSPGFLVLLLLALVLTAPATYAGPTSAPADPNHQPADPNSPPPDPNAAAGENEDDRLSVNAFFARVVNRFAATSRLMVLDEENNSTSDNAVGFTLDYVLWGCKNDEDPNSCPQTKKHKPSRWDVSLFFEAVHSARVVESPCDPNGAADPNNPKPAECEVSGSKKGVADPNDFFKLIEDANTLEWLGGATVGWKFNKGETMLYAKLQGGFIRAPKASDDLIDNHFAGIGIEKLGGEFDGTSAEFGWGRTDFFAPGKRNDRKKLNLSLYYTPPAKASLVTFFVQGFLDSDFGPTSDDIQIYYGVSLDVREVLGKLGPGK